MSIIFDIETGPLDDLPPFDVASVKLGNLKDLVKVKAKQEEAKAKYIADAALHANMAEIVAIGYLSPHGTSIDLTTEPAMLRTFWSRFANAHHAKGRMIGHYIFGFDLPMLVRRSWINGVHVPEAVGTQRGSYWNWNDLFVDTCDRWKLGDKQAKSTLDMVSRALGAPGKPDGMTGADFAGMLKTDRKKALAYLVSDLENTQHISRAMGLA